MKSASKSRSGPTLSGAKKRLAKSKKKNSPASISSRILRAQDEERQRISRDLHDTVGQSLAAVKMSLQSLARSIPLENGAAGGLRECIQIVDQSIGDVRTVSYLLHPPTLDLAGLGSAIDWYSAGFSKRSGIEVLTELPEDLPRMTTAAEIALFRIVQESLTNVHRYAGATRVKVGVRLTENELRLEVHDNGGGIDKVRLRRSVRAHPDLGVGIPGMRERLGELGGALEIHSGEWGTRIIALLPRSVERRSSHDLPSLRAPNHLTNATDAKANSSKRILVVDDHEVIRRGVRELLEQEIDLEVCDEASNAVEAVEKLQRLNPDLIVLDLQMPGRNGWSVVAELRRMELHTKVLIFTAYEYEGLPRAVRNAGCDGFVTKSKASADLIVAVRAILQGKTFFGDAQALAAHV